MKYDSHKRHIAMLNPALQLDTIGPSVTEALHAE